MNADDFTLELIVDSSAAASFDAINNIPGWWSQDFTGRSTQIGDEFEVRFGDVHYSRHKLVEVIPGKRIVWLITDSKLNFLKDKSEWTGTKAGFELTEIDGKTRIEFTHWGLVPAIECFNACSGGWKHYLSGSLLPFINTGKGNPQLIKENCEKSKA